MQSLLNKDEWDYTRRKIIKPLTYYATVVYSFVFLSALNAANSGISKSEFLHGEDDGIVQLTTEPFVNCAYLANEKGLGKLIFRENVPQKTKN